MSLPIHLIIAIEMAVFAGLYGFLGKKNLLASIIITSLLNGIIAPATFIFLPQFGIAFFTAMLLPLLVASFVNVLISALVYKAIASTIKSSSYDS
ncbi:MAG: hypothetical protein ACOX2A_05485 [Tepidanaerobacteraceae bacterium]